MKRITLETERLLIRPFTLADVDGVFEFASNKLCQQHTGNDVITSKEAAQDLIENVWLKDYAEFGYGRFAVIHKTDNKIIGFNGIKFLKDIQATDLGYRFLPEYWGKGIATEASKPILKFAFEDKKLAEVIATVYPENSASTAVLKKLGFQHIETKTYPEETTTLDWYSLKTTNYEG
ncbi:GNAT family N-acetyltransferase [Patiriisocius marinus]|uniref:GNAT family N-acetyltransferase n=1 Tax=Patiriisocius marinus TaxID=1397112 RepID=UPI00233015B2|nr:GNAT family N-acetyltransferase [Patiriisocius marinus]